jgi:twinkle protein
MVNRTRKTKISKKEPCPKCGSKDNLARFPNGSAHCFTPGCGYHEYSQEGHVPVSVTKAELMGVVDAIPDRRISQATCRKFNVHVEYGNDGTISKHHYPVYSDDGELVGTKTRICKTKDFYVKGSLSAPVLFGQNTCKGKGKYITITEGEIDALSISEMFDRKWDVVSLKNGASSAKKEIQQSLEFLEGYDAVVVCFDQDLAGQKAVDSIKDLFSPHKLRIAKLPAKDANELLVANRIQEFTKAWWDAKPYRPDGIIAGADLWEEITKAHDKPSVLYPWQGLNTLTRGFRQSELVTITSGSGMGKSQMVRELEYHLLQATGDNIGVLALEENTARTALGIMSVAANCPLHLEENLDHDTIRPFFEATLGTGRYYLYDHFGSTGLDNLLSRIRFMVKSLDCRWIILDHLSIVVSSQENGDERKAIDEVMTRLRTLVQELGIGMFLVSHLRRAGGQAHEDGGRISLSELRGSQSIAQLSDIVIGLERDQQHEDPLIRNTSTVRVLKNRYTGQTGPATYLQYQVDSGRMVEVTKPEEDSTEDEF